MPAGIDPWVMAALAASEAEAGRVRVFARRWPRLAVEGWPGGDVFFVDASAVTARRQGGEASLVKLAVLHRRPGGWERLLAPMVAEGAPPVLYLGGGERLRQAIVYVVELASLLALSRATVAGEARLEGPRVLVRHGPLLQQLSHLFSPVYDVDWDTGYAALRYAGLGRDEAVGLLDDSRAGAGRVNLGLLALRLLGEMAREAEAQNTRRSGEGLLFAGVIEDTSRSRVLVSSLLADAMLSEAWGDRDKPCMDTSCLAKRLLSGILGWSSSYGTSHGVELEDCLCGDDPLATLTAEDIARELVAPVLGELRVRFRASLLGAEPPHPPLSIVEAAAISSGAVPDITDSELLYNLVYLGLDPGTGFTLPRSRGAVAEWAAHSLELKRRKKLSLPEEPGRLVWPARRILYTYMLPDKPPSCRSLAAQAQRLGLDVCSLSRLVTVAPAVRVEWLTPVDPGLLEGFLSAVYWASRLVVYKYPPQLLVVDAASRVTWSEYAGLEMLAEEIARRRRPYSSFLRGWTSRGAMLSTGI